MNSHYTYYIILAASLAGPLALSFDKKVAFYKRWKYLVIPMLIPAALYVAWDSFFTKEGVWWFNEKYITGHRLFGLPIEEILFFFVVPYCCVFVYECIRCYFPNLKKKVWGNRVLQLIAVLSIIAGAIFYDKYYTSWTFFFLGIFIGMVYVWKSWFKGFDAVSFVVSYIIILVPFLVVNGFLTAIPVVLYNDAENLGIRIYTIPFEDTFYGMLLIMMNVALYERVLKREQFKSQK